MTIRTSASGSSTCEYFVYVRVNRGERHEVVEMSCDVEFEALYRDYGHYRELTVVVKVDRSSYNRLPALLKSSAERLSQRVFEECRDVIEIFKALMEYVGEIKAEGRTYWSISHDVADRVEITVFSKG